MFLQEAGKATLYVDGAAKGNPGPAGIGVRVEAGGELVVEFCDYIGQTTNNAAEYRALIQGLQMVREVGATGVQVISDSELMVRQLNGDYRVKSPSLLPLYQEAQQLAQTFNSFQIRHVPRSENREADRLANRGILRGKTKGETASGPDGRAQQGEESPSSTGQGAG